MLTTFSQFFPILGFCWQNDTVDNSHSRLKSVALITVAIGLVFQATPAFAQTVSFEARLKALEAEFEARSKALEAEISKLRSALAVVENPIIQIENIPQNSKPIVPSKANDTLKSEGFKVGNTELKFGGHIDLDVHLTKTSDGALAEGLAEDVFVPSLTPVGDGTNDAGDFQLDTTVNTSRLVFSTSTPAGDKDIKTHIGLDFLVSPGGNELISNSFNPRIRRVFVDYNGWRLGQDWSTFQGTHALTESASFRAPVESQVFVRQPQVRYTHGNFQFAVENPETFVNVIDSEIAAIGAGGEAAIQSNEGALPDFVARYNFKGDWGIVSLAGLARNLSFETEDSSANGIAFDDSTFGYGLSLTGRINTIDEDDFRFSLNGGKGIGRYIGSGILQGAQANLETGELAAIGAISANGTYRHVRGPWSFNLGLSWIDIDLDSNIPQNLNETGEAYSGYLAILKKVAPSMTFGVEYLNAERELVSGVDGDLDRFTFSAKKNF